MPSGAGLFNSWLVNGKEYPHDQEFVLKQGGRYRLIEARGGGGMARVYRAIDMTLEREVASTGR